MRRCVSGKDALVTQIFGPSSLSVVAAARQNICKQNPQKGALHLCGWTDAEYLVHTNEQSSSVIPA